MLAVGQLEANKTRLIRVANLNPACFERYVGFCVQAGFLELRGDRYRTTNAGEIAVGAIGRILSKAEELDAAVRELGSVARGGSVGAVPAGHALRFASAVAWSELLLGETRPDIGTDSTDSGDLDGLLDSDGVPRGPDGGPRRGWSSSG